MSDYRALGVPAVNTSSVTSPRTGFRYLDEVLRRPGSVLAFAHRGGAYHPEIEGLENTMAAFQHAVDLGYGYLETDVHVTRDGVLLAFHDQVLDRVSDRRGAIAALTHAEVQAALIGGRERVPTLAELFDAFPDARFNIDLKSEGAVAAAGRLRRRPRGVGPGAGRARSRRAGSTLFRELTGGRVPTSAHPVEVVAFRPAAQRTARGPAHPRSGRRPADPAPARSLGGRHPGSRTTRARGRQARARVDDRRPRRDARAPRPRCRRADDRPHRHTQIRAHRARSMEG